MQNYIFKKSTTFTDLKNKNKNNIFLKFIDFKTFEFILKLKKRYGDMIENVRARTKGVKKLLKENEYQLITPTFPLLGVNNNHAKFIDFKDTDPKF